MNKPHATRILFDGSEVIDAAREIADRLNALPALPQGLAEDVVRFIREFLLASHAERSQKFFARSGPSTTPADDYVIRVVPAGDFERIRTALRAL